MLDKNEDIGVALVFFSRPKELQQVFNSIKAAQPSKLFLIQDGARDEQDVPLIEACRKIVEKVDWECEVYKNYSEKNLGCGQRVYSGLQWAFDYVEKLIVVEDDCVPSVDFFRFCNLMLNRYELDKRVDIVCGMNHLGIYQDTPNDYIFCETGSISGWATWKRCWEGVDFNLSYLNDDDAIRLLEAKYGKKLIKHGRTLKRKLCNEGKLTSWSHQRGINQYLSSALSIVPKYNLIKDIGISENSANSVASIKLIPRGLRRVYRLDHERMPVNVKHPKYIVSDVEYDKHVRKIMGGGWCRTVYRKLEVLLYRLVAGEFSHVAKKINEHIGRE